MLPSVQGVLTAFAHGSAIAHNSIKEVGADELLLTLPMVENARNIIDLCLQRGCFQVNSVLSATWCSLLLQTSHHVHLRGYCSGL